jgi:hypothetical protein
LPNPPASTSDEPAARPGSDPLHPGPCGRGVAGRA